MPLRFTQPVKPKKEKLSDLISEIKYTPTTEKSFDGPKLDIGNVDEMAQIAEPTPLTKEQKLELISKLEAQKAKVLAEHTPINVHPKVFQLKREVRVSDIEEQIENLKNQ